MDPLKAINLSINNIKASKKACIKIACLADTRLAANGLFFLIGWSLSLLISTKSFNTYIKLEAEQNKIKP